MMIKLSEFAVVSDLHLGRGYGGFEKNRGAFLRFLAFLNRQRIPLIVAGDLFELWRATPPEILRKNEDILSVLAVMKREGMFFFTPGNHDFELLALSPFFPGVVSPSFQVETGSQTVWIEHGHRFDPYNRSPGPLVRLMNKIGDKFPQMHTGWDIVQRKGADRGDMPYEAGAESILKKPGVRTCIMGHTHRPMTRTFGNGTRYFNSGSWLDKRRAFVHVNYDRVRLDYWEENA